MNGSYWRMGGTRSNPESSIAIASPYKPVQQSHKLQQYPYSYYNLQYNLYNLQKPPPQFIQSAKTQ